MLRIFLSTKLKDAAISESVVDPGIIMSLF